MKWMESNTAALPWIQIALTLVTIVWWGLTDWDTSMWLWSLGMYCIIGCVGISVGYHRLLTHRSFKTSKFWEGVCTWCGMLAFTGSSIGWVGVHRDHHRYSDHAGDPHSPHQAGAWMLLANYIYTPDKWAVRNLITDKFHVFMHRYYFGLLLGYCAVHFLIGSVDALMHLALIPATISIWVSTVSNYMNHKWGYTNYPSKDKSRNNWLNALFTFGEGWHNNHHTHPGAWKFGHRWFEIDMGSWFVRLIKQ